MICRYDEVKLFSLRCPEVGDRGWLDHHSPVATGRDVSASEVASGQFGSALPAPSQMLTNNAVRTDRANQRAAQEGWIDTCLAGIVLVRGPSHRR